MTTSGGTGGTSDTSPQLQVPNSRRPSRGGGGGNLGSTSAAEYPHPPNYHPLRSLRPLREKRIGPHAKGARHAMESTIEHFGKNPLLGGRILGAVKGKAPYDSEPRDRNNARHWRLMSNG